MEENYADPRLATLYDPLDPDRSDLVPYAAMADEFDARRVLDIGCGTGVFALLLADRGYDVIGLEPARASLDVARGKPGADRVRWIDGDLRSLPADVRADLATMTANVAQAIVPPGDWDATLAGAHTALSPGGRLVFETRVPSLRAWETWPGPPTTTDIAGVGAVTTWTEIVSADLPLVVYRSGFRFPDGAEQLADSTLRFRERDEVHADLTRHGYVVDAVRDAPDRPGREWVFVARAQ